MARRIGKDHMEVVVSFLCVVRMMKFVCICPVRFVRVELLKEQLLENNKQTHWVPDYVKVSEADTLTSIAVLENDVNTFFLIASSCLTCNSG